MATKQLKWRQFQDSNGELYHCLIYDVTEEIRGMFGVQIKEAFAVYKKTSELGREQFEGFGDKSPKTVEVADYPSGRYLQAYTENIRIPEMEEIFVVFDDTHTVCFWTSEWGGMKKTDLGNIDFGG